MTLSNVDIHQAPIKLRDHISIDELKHGSTNHRLTLSDIDVHHAHFYYVTLPLFTLPYCFTRPPCDLHNHHAHPLNVASPLFVLPERCIIGRDGLPAHSVLFYTMQDRCAFGNPSEGPVLFDVVLLQKFLVKLEIGLGCDLDPGC
jgi:hypothetical protein